jgi:uncharacterized protein YutE (UPF0331/DUF86 family)
MIEVNRIDEKIGEIEKFLEELESVLPADLQDYKNDWKLRDVCERHFEKIIEGIVDLVFLFIKENNFKTPEDDKNAFEILENEDIISLELCQKLKDAKGMRNVIAHEYGRVDDEIVFEAITEQIIKDAREFLWKIKKEIIVNKK